MTFVKKIISYLYENNLDYKNLTIILPSQRARTFLENQIIKHHQKVVISPIITTMDEWIRSLVPTTIIDKTRMLIILYDIHKSIVKSNEIQSFDEFIEWGSTLLSDFDEIDRYLVDTPTLFRSLHSIKELEYWHIDELDPSSISPARKKFMEFWQLLPNYYRLLNKELIKHNVSYMGSATKYVAQNIDLIFKDDNDNTFLFAGFNALSTAEGQIIKQLYKLGRGHILVDADAFYIDNYQHEAGSFIRRLFKNIDVKTLPYVQDRLKDKFMDIDVIECAQLTGQVKVATTYLLQLDKKELSQTAIVLADEALISPLLKNIPKHVEKVNITLGMPLKSTAVRNWVDILFLVQEIKQRFGDSQTYYHTILKQLLKHPFFTAILTDEEKDRTQSIELDILQRNWIFISQDKINISERIDKIIKLVGKYWHNSWTIAIETIRELNRLIFAELGEKSKFEKAILYSFDVALIDFNNIINEGLPLMNLRTFKQLFTQHYGVARIAYYGSPTDGLQIMGLLETRALDFKNIIFLGLNEGNLPPTNPIQSMIPMDLRRFVELPTPRDKQGLFAHHFYRLLHNCEKLILTYSSAKETIGSNEKSRYLLQIEKELSRQNTNISYRFQFYNVPTQQINYLNWQSVQKTKDVIKKMDNMFFKSTSISMLNMYHKCPLDFYFRNILEFDDDEDVEEELEASSFGTIVHKTLEELYSPHTKYYKNGKLNPNEGRSLTTNDINNMLNKAPLLIEKAFIKQFNGDKKAFTYGKNNLSFTMAKTFVNKFLKEEKKLIQNSKKIIIHNVEKKIKVPIELMIGEEKKIITLVGTIDRIDEVDGKIRLIDYKTGMCNNEDVTLKRSLRTEKSELQQNLDVKHIMQLLMYCYLYERSTNKLPDTAGVFSMLRINNGLCEMNLADRTIAKMNEIFPSWLEELLTEIYNVDIHFEHKIRYEKINYCLYCN